MGSVRHPPSLPPFSPAKLGFESPWKARPNPAGRAAIGAVTRRHYSSRFPARVVHAPPSFRRKLAQLVSAASSFSSKLVSGVGFWFWQALVPARAFFYPLFCWVSVVDQKWLLLDQFSPFLEPQQSRLQN